jgi:excisionase family DNA binding protein
MTEPARLNDIPSVMHRTKVGRSTIFDLIGSGKLRSVKIGARRLVPESALVEFIERLEAAQSPTAAPCDVPTGEPKTQGTQGNLRKIAHQTKQR